MVKDEVIKMIRNMPEETSVEDIMAELYFRYQVDEGLKQLDEGRGIPHEVSVSVDETSPPCDLRQPLWAD